MVVTTETLAELVEQSLARRQNPEHSKSSAGTFDPVGRDAWYTVLLHQTLAYAETAVEHYRQKFGRECPRAEAFDKLSDLGQFPILTKGEVVENLPSFLSDQAEGQTVHCTSGTTARRLHVYGNYDEERATELLRQLRSPHAKEEMLPLRIIPGPRRLFSPTYPGLGNPGLVIGYSSNQDNHQWFDYTDYLAEVLNSSYWFGGKAERIGIVHITPPWMLEFITRKLVDRGIDPSEFGLEVIAVSGGFTTSRTRKIVEEIWKSEYTSSYSCSEVSAGEALEYCQFPGVFRPGPTFYCEIVDPESYEPVDYGEHGLVLLTSLYPFQQVMPFIRYNTGDIAERVLPLDNEDDNGAEDTEYSVSALRPIGRTGDCLRLGPRHYFGTREVLDALAPFDEIPHVPYPRYELELVCADDSRSIQLSVETVEMSEGKREWLRSHILRNLTDQYDFETWSDEGPLSFKCTLVTKDNLRNYCRLVPSR
jgi:phenylacetate-coenzyme A ligase PaaK-like adenylate-forming protein